MFQLIIALRRVRDAVHSHDWAALGSAVADALNGLGKGDVADALRAALKGVADADAREISVAAAQVLFDALEGYYGFDHVTVKAGAPGADADGDELDATRADKLAAYMEGHTSTAVGVTQASVRALPPELWAALANVVGSVILSILRKRGLVNGQS